ncbi:MAG: galactokinase [Propionibacteriaceae bacterium]|jgi:galactokinase|nr:galactokinase [Propionibacteriaceae bacterium]
MPDDGPARAKRLFEQRFGAPPDGVWGAPGRVNLIGEHTDYNAGLVLPIALPQRTFAAARPRGDRRLRLASESMEPVEIALDDVGPGNPASWAAYPAGVLWALERAGCAVAGLDAAFASDVPIGAGLSSSAAIEAAMGAAASDLFGLGLLDGDATRSRLAACCVRAENEIAKAPTGGMDQAAALRSLAGRALYLDCLDGSAKQVPMDLDAVGLELLVIDTRAKHELVDGQYGSRRAECERACEALGVPNLRAVAPAHLDAALAALDGVLARRVRHVVTEIERVRLASTALESGDFARLGELFNQSHASMRDDFEISCPELDLAQETALDCGALGARMTGGGFGGSAIALIGADRAQPAMEAVAVAFAKAGFAAPAFLLAAPSQGAERLW